MMIISNGKHNHYDLIKEYLVRKYLATMAKLKVIVRCEFIFHIKIGSLLLLLFLFFIHRQLLAATVNDTVNVTATIGSGCILGSGNSDVTTFGTLNFGTISSLSSNINVASTDSAGTIIVKCTSGLSFTIALNSGQNSSGSISSGRKMLLTGGSQTLNYQLYQNNSHSTIWGNGSNGGTVLSSTATGSIQKFVIYGTLFASGSQPQSGQYVDTVVATVSY